jgi:aminoglycoside 3-N-acetyltransferase I
MDTEILKLNHNDLDNFSALISVFEDVFEWEVFSIPQRVYLERLLQHPNFIVFVAKSDTEVVGGLTAYVIDRYDTEKPSAYIYDIAVVTNFQRQGIGKLLIAALNDYCKTNGFSEVFVQAETADIHAVNFYKKTAISSELAVKHFTYSFASKDNDEQRRTTTR